MSRFYITNNILKNGKENFQILKKDQIVFGRSKESTADLDDFCSFENFTILFDGRIYNLDTIESELVNIGYLFETKKEEEILLKGYKEWGSDVVAKLNGMFAFVIYDSLKNEIFCSRDRLGVKPLYYYWENGSFEIANQLLSLNENKEINKEAVSMFLDCTYIPSPYSIYKDVFKLLPGCNLEINVGRKELKLSQYWDLNQVEEKNISFNEAKEQLHDLLKDAIKIRMKAITAVGSFLSGGIDSAVVSSIASSLNEKPLKTFTIGFENPDFDESKIATQYASIIQTDHTTEICKPEDFLKMLPVLIQVYDEPFADSSAIPSLLLNKITKKTASIALAGDGGDESFLGYPYFDMLNQYQFLFKIPYTFRYFLSKILVCNLLGNRTHSIRRLLNVPTIKNFVENVFIGTNTLQKKRIRYWLDAYSKYWNKSENLIQQAADLGIKLSLENDSNVKVERASSAFSMEIRSPFLDYRIVEFARSLPIEYRIFKGQKKYILREILKDYIPESVFNQPKKGFAVPIVDWIRNELKDEFAQALSDNFLNTIPNFNVVKFKNMYKEHLQGIKDNSSYIWRVYILSKWCSEHRIDLNKHIV